METERSTGALSAEAMFRLQAEIELHETVTTDTLRDALEVLAGDIMVEVDLADDI
jgi:glycine cleavage system regulatory protein